MTAKPKTVAERATEFKHSTDYDPDDFDSVEADVAIEWYEDVESAGDVGKNDGGIDYTEWERNFMQTLSGQYKMWKYRDDQGIQQRGNLPFSTRQIACLKRMWDRIE